MSYLLDTNICIFFLRGKLDLEKIFKDKGRENCFISEVTVFELRFGAENSDDSSVANKVGDNFVNGLSIIPVYSCIHLYLKEKVRLRKIGKPVNDEFDLLIGLTAIANKLILVTDNQKAFDRLEGIEMENWFVRK